MPIRYIPNDPQAAHGDRVVDPSPGRRGGTIGFEFLSPSPEAQYPANDMDFAYWQVRESSLKALQTWDAVGFPLGGWQNGARRISVNHNAGIKLQATYERDGLRFYRWTHPQEFFVGSSTDAVVHEVGHALLDAIRPDLWHSAFPEIVAFHEAFGDCLALITALRDLAQCQTLINAQAAGAGPLDASSAVSKMAESVALAYRQSFPPQEAPGTARDANNSLAWQFQHMLPPVSNGAGLSSEAHSFSRIFTGCLYSCIKHIYGNLPAGGASLASAADIAGKLLVEAVRNAPVGSEFFRTVGQAMVLVDRSRNAGAHQHHISKAFTDHGIVLGSSALIAPTVALGGGATGSSGFVGLIPETRRHVCKHLSLPHNTRFRYRRVKLADARLTEATYHIDVDAGRFHKELRNVWVRMPNALLLKEHNGHMCITHGIDNHACREDHLNAFLSSLIHNGLLMRGGRVIHGRNQQRCEQHEGAFLAPFSIRRRSGKHRLVRVRCTCHVV